MWNISNDQMSASVNVLFTKMPREFLHSASFPFKIHYKSCQRRLLHREKGRGLRNPNGFYYGMWKGRRPNPKVPNGTQGKYCLLSIVKTSKESVAGRVCSQG
jgi:hypothetical protein